MADLRVPAGECDAPPGRVGSHLTSADTGGEWVPFAESGRREQADAVRKDYPRRAGVEPWSRAWHSLRASCESDLAQSFPLATVTKWLGNTPSVALRHYVDATETAFEKAKQRTPTEGGAKSGAAGTRGESRGGGDGRRNR